MVALLGMPVAAGEDIRFWRREYLFGQSSPHFVDVRIVVTSDPEMRSGAWVRTIRVGPNGAVFTNDRDLPGTLDGIQRAIASEIAKTRSE